MGTHTSNAAGKWTGADSSFNALESTNADLAARAAPENLAVPIGQINDQIRNFSLLNFLRARAAEKEMNPNAFATREALGEQVKADVTGETPIAVQKDLIRAGLGNVLSTGVKPGSTAGASILQNLFGRGSLNYRDQQQAKAAAYLNENPQPIVGIDPGSVGNILVDQNIGNTNMRNQFLERNVARRDSRLSDFFNRLQQSKQASAQQAQGNAAARNQTTGAVISAGAQVAGAALGAVGAVAL